MTVVRDVPLPPCPPAGVLVRVCYSAISPGTERTGVEGRAQSLVARARERPELVRQTVQSAMRDGIRATHAEVRRRLEEGSPSGYSCAGRVVELGPRARELAVGDLVACAGAGHANHAEVVAVPTTLCAKVPAGVDLRAAAMSTLGAIALHAVRLAGVSVGERVAVIGCGLIGQICCRLLIAAGAEVFALDLDRARVLEAVRGGADHGIEAGPSAPARVHALTGGVGVDHAIVTAAASTPEPLELGAALARDRGTLTLVGGVPIELGRSHLYGKELRFQVSRSYGPGRYDAEYEEKGLDYPIAYVRWTERRNMEAVLALQARGRLRLEELVEDVLPVARAPEAYGRLSGAPELRPRGALLLCYPGPAHRPDRPSRREPGSVTAAAPRGNASAEPTLGLIGPGRFAAQVLVPAFRAAGARLELVGGGAGPSADAAVRQLGFARAAASAEAVIEDPAVNIVAIVTRHGDHARLAARALRAGKHVFCEKPLALTVAELEEVMAAAREGPGILAVGFNRRFAPLAVRLREALRDAGGPIAALYRVSAGTIAPEHWVHDLEQGGGRVLGEVCHFLDTLVFLSGAPITDLHASGFSRVGAPVQANDNVSVSTRHGDGSLGTVVYVAESAPSVGKERLEAFAPRTIGVLEDFKALYLHGSRPGRIKARGPQKGHLEEAKTFLEAARSGTCPIPLEELENVSLAALATVESMRTGARVRVDVASGSR
jgi:predicted dehydrogenase/threonine dehydrogenase-like Zn-dependent dehydrogenase